MPACHHVAAGGNGPRPKEPGSIAIQKLKPRKQIVAENATATVISETVRVSVEGLEHFQSGRNYAHRSQPGSNHKSGKHAGNAAFGKASLTCCCVKALACLQWPSVW